MAARRAFLDAQIEEAARKRYEALVPGQALILKQIEILINDSDMVELNVMGSLNSSLMFYRGLVDGGAFDLGEADILADIWSQEDQFRLETESWLGAFC